MTAHRYLRDRRLDRARELPVTTSLPVTEICDHIGFQSLGSFNSLFSQTVRRNPRRISLETPQARLYPDVCYGIEANMKDGVGNWFSMTQHKPH